jgi:hypothetical protein
MLVNSGVAGFGTNIVFLTSLRPRSVFDRRAGVACYGLIRAGTIMRRP